MISKIVWPETHVKGNPFGGIDGFRRLTITFHSASFDNLSPDDKKALEILLGFANLDQIDAVSFGNEISSKIIIGTEESKYGNFDVWIVNKSGKVLICSGVPKFWIDRDNVIYFMGMNSAQIEGRYLEVRQDLLEVGAHQALGRDIFITSSRSLLDNRDRLFNHPNVRTPLEALKIVALYLRTHNQYEWLSGVKENVTFISQESFHKSLARALLPSSWRYLSCLGLHTNHEELIQLGWSILHRCSRALQARDEIARLFYMPETHSTRDQRSYHFDYITLLLTAAFDVEALVINQLYELKSKDDTRLLDSDCGFQKSKFKAAIKKESRLKALSDLIDSNKDYIEILYPLRNKIHSISLEASFHLPDNYQDQLFDKIYNYDAVNHWGINKQKITLIKNGAPPVPVYQISIEIYTLVHYLIDAGFSLIDTIMRETNIELLLDAASIGKIRDKPPVNDFAPTAEICLLLG